APHRLSFRPRALPCPTAHWQSPTLPPKWHLRVHAAGVSAQSGGPVPSGRRRPPLPPAPHRRPSPSRATAGRRPARSHRVRPTEYARTARSPPLLPLPESAAAIVEPAPQATGPGPSPLAVLFTHQRTVGAFELRPQRRGRVATAIGVQKVLPCAVIANRTAHE